MSESFLVRKDLEQLRFPQSHLKFTPFLLKLDWVLSTRGAPGLIIFVKSVRAQLLNYLSGNQERVKELRLTSDGIPKCLGDLIP